MTSSLSAIKTSELSRRGLLKLGAAGAGAAALQILSPRRSDAGDDTARSPATTPFAMPLPIPPVLQPVASLSPPPNPAAHQLYSQYMPRKFYEIRTRAASHSFHPKLPTQKIFGYNGITPGPTIHARYGEPILTRFVNDLPENHTGFGVPQISPHLHNLHVAPESDGNPVNFFDPGFFWDNHYPMFFPRNDYREALGTLWCHDHRFDFTAQNTYRGLAMFFLAFDALDAGVEIANRNYPNALRLPSGAYDVPLMLADKRFNSAGNLAYDVFNLDGVLGDKYTVNGKIQPFFKVARRKYRFRILNGGPSRFYQLHLSNNDPFVLIGNDGNLLPNPLTVPHLYMGVAERMDVIIDFSKYPIGSEIVLQNRLVQDDGRGPEDELMNPGTPLLKFIVDRNATDPSVIPANLRPLPPINMSEVVATRRFKFDRTNGAWSVNNELFDPDRVQARVKRGTAEIWYFENGGGGWHHPIHFHHEEFRILDRDGVPPRPHEQGRKDVVILAPGEVVKIFVRFSDFLGTYPIHCHNTVHEDHAMMTFFEVVP